MPIDQKNNFWEKLPIRVLMFRLDHRMYWIEQLATKGSKKLKYYEIQTGSQDKIDIFAFHPALLKAGKKGIKKIADIENTRTARQEDIKKHTDPRTTKFKKG